MTPLVDLRIAAWAPALPWRALAACPFPFLAALAGLLAVAAGSLAVRAPRGAWGAAVLFAGLTWILRDRLYLLGDSRLWIHAATEMGTRVPLHQSPLAAKIMGGLGGAGEGTHTATALALLMTAAGLLTWGIVAWGFRGSTGSGAARLAPALLFASPLGVIFYGHVETYGLVAVALAAFLVSVRRDVGRGKPGPATGPLFAVLCLTHVLAGLLVLPLAVWFWGRRRPFRAWLAAGAVLGGVALAAAWFVPAVRTHVLYRQGWSAGEIAVYLADTANAWFLVALPAGVLAVRSRAWGDPYGRFLALAALTFAVVPLGAVFTLGLYRDLDLMTPAFLCLVFLALNGVERHRALSSRELLGWIAGGAVFLASILALGLDPAGEGVMERHLRRGAMTTEGRSYGWEVLAFAARDRGDLFLAQSRLESALAVLPGNHRLYGPLGEIQLARGDTTGAIASLTRAMATPRAPVTAPLLAELLTRRGDAEGAIRLLAPRRASLLGDRRGAAALAVAYFQAGLPESTVAVARDRLAVDPADDVAHVNAASGLIALGRVEAAAGELADAARLVPDRLDYHRRLVRTLLLLPDGRARAEAYLRGLPPELARAVTDAP